MVQTINGIQIESFATDEPTEPHDLTLHREIAERLNLTGQLKRMSTPTSTTNPFPVCETNTFRLIRCLCPITTPLSDFDAELIPLRVLELIELAQKSGLTVFKVHHPEVMKDDPFIMGYESDRYDARPYLVARWGKHLLSWGEMHNQVCSNLHKQALAAIAELETAAKSLKSGNLFSIPSWASSPKISVSYY